ncbi:hypothetical protein E2C01_095727 [Portunus trituberculatus]|uniref:Uncharacterized protein n=1 Tax=Portunus trituberculatus TaxID=210409 RepID=A0A5B7K130_PORTR|nr:hypothetical protein [Portunus trituberculatus]
MSADPSLPALPATHSSPPLQMKQRCLYECRETILALFGQRTAGLPLFTVRQWRPRRCPELSDGCARGQRFSSWDRCWIRGHDWRVRAALHVKN